MACLVRRRPYRISRSCPELQRHCVRLFERLVASQSAQERARFQNFLDYARRHCDVILRFGRFPHRNAVLGRLDTPEELAYLATPGSGF